MKFHEFVMKVQSISKIGKLFSKDPYALENYEELEKLSTEMLNGELLDQPIENNIYQPDIYPTPNVSVRTMVFNDDGHILLVQEKQDQKWSLPGGWCDVFESPAENALKEVYEESGLRVQIDKVLGVFFRDRYKVTIKTLISEYSIYFKGSLINEGDLPNKIEDHEILDAKFFSLEQLPPLSHKISETEFNRALHALRSSSTDFD